MPLSFSSVFVLSFYLFAASFTRSRGRSLFPVDLPFLFLFLFLFLDLPGEGWDSRDLFSVDLFSTVMSLAQAYCLGNSGPPLFSRIPLDSHVTPNHHQVQPSHTGFHPGSHVPLTSDQQL
nr:hypothetical protein Itr_chr11CG01010 [Ipomoea trifida]